MGRWWIALVMMGCSSLKELTPEGPVLDYADRVRMESAERPSGVRYRQAAVFDLPVAPLQAFGMTYDLDLVFRTRHTDYDMHEYARITTPDGPLWIAKDASLDKVQTIVSEMAPDVLPEIPLQRKQSPVQVEDRSTRERIDLTLRYESFRGEQIVVDYRGPWPVGPQKKRNSNTMGHSADSVMAVLDLSHRSLAKKASLTIDGEETRPVRIAGLVPFQVALSQTQAGLSKGHYRVEAVEGRPGLLRTIHEQGQVQSWAVSRGDRHVDLVHVQPWRTLRQRFLVDGEAMELSELWVEQYGQAAAAAHVRFDPALPDARMPFVGEASSNFVIDVGGQAAHGVGRVVTRWEGGRAIYEVRPDAPSWVADRPMRSVVQVGAKGADVRIEMVGM